MLRFNNKNKLACAILSILAISSCGGGGGGKDTSPPSRVKGVISGNVFDAPVSGATVSVYEYQNGKVGRLLGQTSTNPVGDYLVKIDASTMPLMIKAEGGAYRDPLTKNIVSLSEGKIISMSSVINYTEGTDQTVMVTPLTYQVAGLAEYNIGQGLDATASVDNAISTFISMYGFNVNTTKPIDITTGGQSSFASAGHQYGALLTAYSSYSYDFIKQYPGSDSELTYTSMNLSDIGYRDISADGKLDGRELDSSGLLKDMAFGQSYVTSDLYTQSMAQHVLIVVSDPDLNISGTPVSDYKNFSQHINDLGTNGSGSSVIPPRSETDIDLDPPVVTRLDSDTLKGDDSVDIGLSDAIGVDNVQVMLQWKMKSDSSWSTEFECPVSPAGEYCQLDTSDFKSGPRDTKVKVNVFTLALDALDTDPQDDDPVQARLVVYASDVLGNGYEAQNGVTIDFDWDNIAPVIVVNSADAISSSKTDYTLEGIVKENPAKLSYVQVRLGAQNPTNLECSEINEGSNVWCKFSQIYTTSSFGDSTLFNLTAEDILGNKGQEQFTVYKDDTPPVRILEYPDGVEMNFIVDDNPVSQIYRDTTYDAVTVDESNQYLKIDYAYAVDGIKATLGNINFADFEASTLNDNKIPYVKVTVYDPTNGDIYGTSADKLTLSVEYYRKKNIAGSDYQWISSKETQASTDSKEAGIPHEQLIREEDGRVSEVIYYIPYVKEILGTTFASTTEEYSQKLVIKVRDSSGNVSDKSEVYFKSTFDLPSLKVVTPFINATARIEGLKSINSDFSFLASCNTEQVDSVSGEKALDVAECETQFNPFKYEFFRVVLQSNAGTHYYQWQDSLDAKKSVTFRYGEQDENSQGQQMANIGAYFSGAESGTVYLTELSVYQTGLFDNAWNALEADDKTPQNAASILTDVNTALESQDASFFGFNPALTQYATTDMLNATIPNPPTKPYQHRFLLEALADMAASNSAETDTTDYAKGFYDDFLYDGKANGQGTQGQITIGNRDLSADTYRSELAQSYFNVATTQYQVDASTALKQADLFAMANPSIGSDTVFDSPGESIDKFPPEMRVLPDALQSDGRFISGPGQDYTITGKIASTLSLEDISGIETSSQPPQQAVYWYSHAEPSLRHQATDVEFILDPSSDAYHHGYHFTLDSESSEYPDVARFEIVGSAQDSRGNATGNTLIMTYYVDNQPPTMTLATTMPEHPGNGESVQVTLTFDEPVSGVEAILAGVNITFTENDASEEWVGNTESPIVLSAGDTTIPLLLKATYSDGIGHTGERVERAVSVTPMVTVNNVTDDNVITEAEATSVVISGSAKGFAVNDKLKVEVTSRDRPEIDRFEQSDVVVQADGNWATAAHNLTSWEQSDIDIRVSGTNSDGIESGVASHVTRYEDSIAPQVNSVDVSPEHPEDQKPVTLSLTFSERVKEVQASVEGVPVAFSVAGDVSQEWEGTTNSSIALVAGQTQVEVQVSRYLDTANNPGNPTPYVQMVNVKPVIELDPIAGGNGIDQSEAESLIISGQARGFAGGELLTVKAQASNSSDHFSVTALVQADGVWATAAQNIRAWPSGDIEVSVSGSNSESVAASSVTESVRYEDTVVPEITGDIQISPQNPVNGSKATITVTFSELVNNVSASLDGVDVIFPNNELATTWTGETASPLTLSAGSSAVIAEVKAGYTDVSGNSGAAKSTNVAVKPQLSLSPVAGNDEIDSAEASSVVIEGTGVGFASGDSVTVAVVSTVDPTYSFEDHAEMTADGHWQTAAHNLTAWPVGDVSVNLSASNSPGIDADSVSRLVTRVDTQPPSAISAESQPLNPQFNQAMTLTVKFDEPVTGITAKVGDVNVDFGDTSSASDSWSGTTNAPVSFGADETSIDAVIRDFVDASGNPGAAFSHSIQVTPLIQLNAIAGDDVIDSDESHSVTITGSSKGFKAGDELSVHVMRDTTEEYATQVSVASDGNWDIGSPLDWSSWEVGQLTVLIDGTNLSGSGVAATQVSRAIEIRDTLAPGMTTLNATPENPTENDKVNLALTFDEPVAHLSATVAGKVVDFGDTTELATNWNGVSAEIALPVNATSVTVLIDGYQDSAGNSGQPQTHDLEVIPLLTRHPVTGDDIIDATESASVILSGEAKGFLAGDTVEVTVISLLEPDTDHATVAATLNSSGEWITDTPVDMSGWQNGSLDVTVIGTNAAGHAAPSQTGTIELAQ